MTTSLSLRRLMVRAVTIIRPATTIDRYGNTQADWDNATRTTVQGWLGRRDAEEVTGRRAGALVDRWHLTVADPSVDLHAGDRVEVDGLVFEVDGRPLVAWTPTGGPHHVEADLRAVEG